MNKISKKELCDTYASGKAKKHIANAVTGARIFGSILLAFAPAFSASFYAVYLICGLSDMLDGTVARKTNSSSPFGATLDTSADFLFAAVSLAKLAPYIPFPGWLWIWIAVIALIKAANIVLGLIQNKRLATVHSVMNKVAGGLLFLFPLTLSAIELKYSAAIVCSIATAAAIQEGYFIRTGRVLLMRQERKKNNEIWKRSVFSCGK